MARVVRTRTINAKETRRSWRIQIDSPTGQPPTITAHRETILTDENDQVLGRSDAGYISRRLDKVQFQQINLPGGIKLNGAQVAMAVEQFIEQWDVEEEAVKAARKNS